MTTTKRPAMTTNEIRHALQSEHDERAECGDPSDPLNLSLAVAREFKIEVAIVLDVALTTSFFA